MYSKYVATQFFTSGNFDIKSTCRMEEKLGRLQIIHYFRTIYTMVGPHVRYVLAPPEACDAAVRTGYVLSSNDLTGIITKSM